MRAQAHGRWRGGALAAAVLRLLVGAVAAEWNFNSFDPSPDLLLGKATYTDGLLQLTNAWDSQPQLQTSAALLSSPVELIKDQGTACTAASFTSAFSFQFADAYGFQDWGSGITFAIIGSNANPTMLTDGTAGRLGYFYSGTNRPGSLAVEFDVHQDLEYGDPDRNHVGLDMAFSTRSLITAPADPIVLADGSVVYVWIEYEGGSELTLSVYVSASSMRPSEPLLKAVVDMCAVLRPAGCTTCSNVTSAYVGFTASTGDGEEYETQNILSWNFLVKPIPTVA